MRKISDILKQKFKRLSVFLKITMLFEIVLILSLIFVSTITTSLFARLVKEKEIALGKTRIEKLADYMLEKYNRVYSLSIYIHSSNISGIMSDIVEGTSDAYEFQNINAMNVFFRGVSSADSDICDVILALPTGNMYSYTYSSMPAVSPSYEFMEDSVVKDFLDKDQEMTILYSKTRKYALREKDSVVSFMGKIYDPSYFPKKKLVGIYIMNIPSSKFGKVLDMEEGKQKGELILVNSEKKVLYSTSSLREGTTFNRELERKQKNSYFVSDELGTTGLEIEYILSNRVLYKEINILKRNISIGICIAVILTLLLSFRIYKIFKKRVKVLIGFMGKLQERDFNINVPVESEDEIGILSRSFNTMCKELNEYIDKAYKAEIQRVNSEVYALQMQIDPHFLYNTLESIKSKALDEGDTVTPEMITLLGNLFRWSTRIKDKFIILEEEINYIETYLQLQSYRFDEKLDVDIHIPEEYMDYAIPKLILQPIVENVIKHAYINVDRPGIVGIIAKKKAEKLEITVFDNGCGMSEEQLQKVHTQLEENSEPDNFESIGIENVHFRIRLLFGKEYGLVIKSIPNQGTAVKIIIPAMTVREMNNIVQVIDS